MKIKKLIYGLLGTGGILVACDKIEEGYMSSNIYYVTDPFTVEQGLTTYSEALELDNSTGPVNVECERDPGDQECLYHHPDREFFFYKRRYL